MPAWLDSLVRMAAALVIGAAIGWERQARGRPAGLRTHMLVGLGAAVIVALASDGTNGDVGRAIQGVATGVGFICAGDILHQYREGEERVKGLTSAAALWVTAALGMAAATRRWGLAFGGAVATVLTLTVARRLEKVTPKDPERMETPRHHDAKARPEE
jgi:putative Mg2+ transporter-C (MgtC) family protein